MNEECLGKGGHQEEDEERETEKVSVCVSVIQVVVLISPHLSVHINFSLTLSYVSAWTTREHHRGGRGVATRRRDREG